MTWGRTRLGEMSDADFVKYLRSLKTHASAESADRIEKMAEEINRLQKDIQP